MHAGRAENWPEPLQSAVALISEHIEVLARALEIAGGNADELKSLVRGSPLEPPSKSLSDGDARSQPFGRTLL